MKEKHEKKKGPINKKTWSFSGKVFVLKNVKRKMQEFFLRREKQEERENTKEHFSLLRTNQQETHFQKKNQYKRNQIKNNMVFLKKREYVTEEKTKGEKNDDQTEQSPQKKRYMKNESNRGKTFKNENKKTCSKTNENKSKRKNRSKKRRTNMQNINMKRCTTKKKDRQTSFFEFVEVP